MPPDPPAADYFWVLAGGQPAGPLTAEQLQRRLAAGKLTYGTQVCKAGGTEWQPLHAALGLAPGVPLAPVAPRRDEPVPLKAAVPRPQSPPFGSWKLRRRVLAGLTLLVVLCAGYATLRKELPAAFAGYERGYGDTILRYADRSYEGAKWEKIKGASLGTLWRVAGWDDDNLWLAGQQGHLAQLRDGHWRDAGQPEYVGEPWIRPIGPEATLIARGQPDIGRKWYVVSSSGAKDLGDLDFCNRGRHVELFSPERDVYYCYTSETPNLNDGPVRVAEGVQTVLSEDEYKEAFVHDSDNTPPQGPFCASTATHPVAPRRGGVRRVTGRHALGT